MSWEDWTAKSKSIELFMNSSFKYEKGIPFSHPGIELISNVNLYGKSSWSCPSCQSFQEFFLCVPLLPLQTYWGCANTHFIWLGMFGHTDMSQICWHFQTATMVVVTRRDESWGPFASDGKLFMYGDYSNLNFCLTCRSVCGSSHLLVVLTNVQLFPLVSDQENGQKL
jgi:hypothetical protein